MIYLTNDFNQFVFSSGKPTLIEFYADWCGACRNFQPKFEMIASGLQQYDVGCGRVNIDTDRDLAMQYGIQK